MNQIPIKMTLSRSLRNRKSSMCHLTQLTVTYTAKWPLLFLRGLSEITLSMIMKTICKLKAEIIIITLFQTKPLRAPEEVSNLLRANLRLTVVISQGNFQLDPSIAKTKDFPLEKEQILSKIISHPNYKK